MPRIELVTDDLTHERVDAIVNAANSSLLGGGGVDGAIHRAGGPEILAECRALRAGALRDGLPTGEAVATGAGRLAARWVIHTVGPVWPGSAGPEASARRSLLIAAHRNSLALAADLGAGSIAFPAISAGVYGWPVDDVADVALSVASTAEADAAPPHVRFVLFSERVADAYRAAADRLGVEVTFPEP
ncbi:O-acetyl-ADP-ribose deacetylase [Agromyces intestinalis]|uniref:O-acetyl-ADP-ribose deacetylase n=1 Tax=Agromyces intestinalis TaxID=2592652 RepID=A0A5C1YBM9_9MICO|nr:O-acetyl-ADP-ribose deacetylase [Agromyces intestinalis]QEO13376.1 O-acetyl-ADP-ribose deacetylase [Agromyces intestinalis]